MIKIHHSRRARSARVIWLLEELGVSYELVTFEFTPEKLKDPDYLKLHPLGQIPVIEDGDVTMFESGAIVEYLLEKHGNGRLAPRPGTNARAEYLQWFHFGEASLATHVSEIVKHRFGTPPLGRKEDVVADARERARAAFRVVDGALAGKEYVLGAEFSAADIMLAYGCIIAKIVGELPKEFTNIAAYIDRLKTRPAYARAWA